jgi:two-component system, chemotaxis family, sensor kinase CheA
MDDLLEDFIAETRETLETLTSQLVEWEQNPQDRALIDSVFRFVHTVKGSCGFLELPRLLRLSHAAEDVLSSARDGALAASTGLVSAALAVIDRIAVLTDALETGSAVYDDDDDLIDAMLAFVPRDHAATDDLGDAETLGDFIEEIEQDDHPAKSKVRTVRVSLALLDKLMSGVSDMVLARNEVSRQLRKSGLNSEIEHSFGRLSASVAEMRDAVGMMRMQNIDRLFSSLPRLLRDISIALGKDIELRIDGGEVEVDREMVEALRDPLTHILRNAADHGIESAAERRAAGKDPVGHIRIVARQSGNQILIEIIDDGQGINLEKLGTRAIAAKTVTASEWSKMSERAQLNTIFTPGLSTADHITSISGRGVGMDVVRNNLQAIGGTIELENYEGRGLKMTLRLPLTLSIIAGLSVRAGDQIFGISRSSVVELVSVSNVNVKIEELGSSQVAWLRGERYPFARLESILGIDTPDGGSAERRTLIIMRPAIGATFALEVASVIDNEELVIKPGAPLVMSAGLFAGTSLPDNGRPMLLLDASGLAAAIGVDMVEQHDNVSRADANIVETIRNRPSALLYIATDGRKRAIRLSSIDRMEDVDAAQIRHIGGKMRVSVDGGLFDVCELDSAPTEGLVKLLKLTDGETSKYLAVEDVLDIFTIDTEIVPSAHPALHEGVIEALGEPVELVNVFQYFEVTDTQRGGIDRAPLCYIDCEEDAQWERRILAPLLTASGYAVSFDSKDAQQAAVVLHRDGANAGDAEGDPRTLHLRDTSHVTDREVSSIYRYDRVGLISAIEEKLAGRA